MKKKRDYSIDSMRATGLILIVLAHTITFGSTLFQIRTFDVPMMVVVSGMSFIISCPEKLNLKTYYYKRIVRLLLPTWTFLSLFFGIYFLYSIISGEHYVFDDKTLGSYLLNNKSSIGYVWIIRVFVLVALAAPLLIWIWRKVKNSVSFSILLAAVFLLYQLAVLYIPPSHNSFIKTFVNTYLYFIF